MSFTIESDLVGPIEPVAFAAAHGLEYEAVASPPPIGGAIFGTLNDASVSNRFVLPGEQGFEVGTVRGVIGGSRSQSSGSMTITTSVNTNLPRSYGYLSVALERMMPHMVLDAKHNDRRFGSSLPLSLSADQRLSLEGDFDDHFSLYCPRDYERDALYVFTPDLMAVLIDEVGDLDVEIIDDRLFVYAPGSFDLTDPAVWRRIVEIIRIVGAKALTRTGRYADARTGNRAANTVAPEARRLDQKMLGSSDPAKKTRFVTFLVVGILAAFVLIIGGAIALAVAVINSF